MTSIILITNPEDQDINKLEWLKEELVKRNIDIIQPQLPITKKYSEWDAKFKELVEQFKPDTIAIVKGYPARFLLQEYQERPIATKGTLIITDNTNEQEEIFSLDYEKIRKKAMKFFIYSFQTTTNFSVEESSELADKLEAEFSILEGAKDLSDYEEILIDIISMEEA
ncbi:hypothetical protein K9L67_05830 [Candidatus Woesearchaeota archaeon]|nr:hypothetical protein [Candidatus Woesearchaeota archaeon]MCF8013853.1 hypothetical protein [Candidatus Woesearchaeota archaeon]